MSRIGTVQRKLHFWESTAAVFSHFNSFVLAVPKETCKLKNYAIRVIRSIRDLSKVNSELPEKPAEMPEEQVPFIVIP
jgi:hypothetical protein